LDTTPPRPDWARTKFHSLALIDAAFILPDATKKNEPTTLIHSLSFARAVRRESLLVQFALVINLIISTFILTARASSIVCFASNFNDFPDERTKSQWALGENGIICVQQVMRAIFESSDAVMVEIEVSVLHRGLWLHLTAIQYRRLEIA
jgi:lysylphosphatidylglycerol synthetase-like protein (DUF2156 family)